MKTPTIHLNGTSRVTLLEQCYEAGAALRTAIDALHRAAPHGRDYYPQGDDALRVATAEHASRIARVKAVYEEIQTIAQAIAATER